MKTNSKKTNSFIKITFSFLIVVILLLQSLPLTTYAETAGSIIYGGIDYSGQGTVINGNISDGIATVQGNYVIIPTYTYGDYTYSSWEKLWASWSDWSTANSKYAGYKGRRYAPENKYIVDVEARSEYLYRRWNPNLNPVYKYNYYTVYRKNNAPQTQTYTSYSYSGYPGARPGYTIIRRGIEREFDYYKGGYEYSTWRTSAPFTWPWETTWSRYNSRTTYRVKMIDSIWDSNLKKNTSEMVPRNYSIYGADGSPLQYGAKWTYCSDISNAKDAYRQVTYLYRYMLNSAGIKELLNGKEDALDQLIKDNGRCWQDFAISGMVDLAVDYGGYFGGTVATILNHPYVAIAIALVQAYANIQGNIITSNMESEYDSIKEIIAWAQDNNLNIVFEYYQLSILPRSNSQGISIGGSTYCNMKEFVSNRTYLSMSYQNNENPTNYFTNNAFGIVSYINDLTSLINDINLYVTLNSLPPLT